MGNDRQVEIKGTVGADSKSGDAVLFTDEEGEDHWIPYSQVTKLKRSPARGGDSITIPVWLAEREGLE